MRSTPVGKNRSPEAGLSPKRKAGKPRLADAPGGPFQEPARDTEAVNKIEIGNRLKTLREARNLSQRELARRAGLPNATISAIELGRSSPSISSLKRILDAFPITLTDFFADVEQRGSVVMPREKLVRFARARGVELLQLVPPFPNPAMQIMCGVYEPGADTGEEMVVHGREEGGVVIRGKFELTVGGDKYIISQGDAFYFDSSKPHRFRNVGKTVGELVTASTPPGL